MTNLNAVFQFGVDNGYLPDNPFKDLAIKGIKNHSGSSFAGGIYPSYRCVQKSASKNLWCVSVYTGVRPGELCALGWEDIDLKNGTMMIRRNLAKDRFTVPKHRREPIGSFILLSQQSTLSGVR
ncbi:hypothetical protein FA041_12005 [Escherichia coli]|nr:hypothetical protein [Escherichia coli]